jgi:hypothetical protein
VYTLDRKNGRIVARYISDLRSENSLPDTLDAIRSDSEEIPVTISWLRPISGIGKEISLVGDQNELGIIDSLEMLDSASRKIAEEELQTSYMVPRIQKIRKTQVHLGNRYFEVCTDRGRCSFIVKNPFICIREFGKDGLFIRDTVGNLFIIESVNALDEKSRIELENVR